MQKLSEKIRQQLVTIWKIKAKKLAHDFSTLLINNMEKQKTQICFVDIKILINSQNITTFTQPA